MAVPFSQLTIPVFLRGLENLNHILRKAQSQSALPGGEPDRLVQARLAANMYPLSGQVQAASDAAKACVGRLSGHQIPRFADTETTFEELLARIAKTIDFIGTVRPDQIDTDVDGEIELALPSGSVVLSKHDYIFKLALPNFYFHLTTAYAILRNQGVELGKSDYLGRLTA